MLFHVTVNVYRSNKDATDVRNEKFVGFVDLTNPVGEVSAPWLMTKAKTIEDHMLDADVPMDVAVEVAKKTDAWLFPAKQEATAFTVKFYNRSQKLSVTVDLIVNRMSIPRVRMPKTEAQHSEE